MCQGLRRRLTKAIISSEETLLADQERAHLNRVKYNLLSHHFQTTYQIVVSSIYDSNVYLVNCTSARDCWQQLIINVTVIHAHLCSSRLKITYSSFQTQDWERLVQNVCKESLIKSLWSWKSGAETAIKTKATCGAKLGGERQACCCASSDFLLWLGVRTSAHMWQFLPLMTVITGCQPSFYQSWWLILLFDLLRSWWLQWYLRTHTGIGTHSRACGHTHTHTHTHTGADKQIKWHVY